MKVVALLALALAAFTPLSVWADDSLVRFEGGVGVHPVSNVSGAANATPTEASRTSPETSSAASTRRDRCGSSRIFARR